MGAQQEENQKGFNLFHISGSGAEITTTTLFSLHVRGVQGSYYDITFLHLPTMARPLFPPWMKVRKHQQEGQGVILPSYFSYLLVLALFVKGGVVAFLNV